MLSKQKYICNVFEYNKILIIITFGALGCNNIKTFNVNIATFSVMQCK